MIDESDLKQQENSPQGARLTEYVLRDLISFGLGQLRAHADDLKNNIIDELFAQLSEDRREEIKAWLRTHKNIPVEVNWPSPGISLPWIACVNAAVNEDPGNTYLGDYAGRQVLGGASREAFGVGLKASTQIWVMTDDPQTAAFLFWICWYILFSNKRGLEERYDVQNLTLSGQDVRWDESLLPEFCYIKMLQAQYDSMFDFNGPEEVNAIFSISLMVATGFTANPPVPANAGDLGPATIVEVPLDDD
jgi:hypothetical protein